MSSKTTDQDRRLEQQYRRLGTRNPVCVVCGERNPFCLELHHIAGQKHHHDVSIICRNDHRKLTSQQHNHVADTDHSPFVTIARYIDGLCDLLAMVIQTLRDFAKRLIESSRGGQHS
jgi:hypothetical protein